MENNARDRETMRAVVEGNLNRVARPTSDRKSIRLDRLVEFLALAAGRKSAAAGYEIELVAPGEDVSTGLKGDSPVLPTDFPFPISQLKSPLTAYNSRLFFLLSRVQPRLCSPFN